MSKRYSDLIKCSLIEIEDVIDNLEKIEVAVIDIRRIIRQILIISDNEVINSRAEDIESIVDSLIYELKS